MKGKHTSSFYSLPREIKKITIILSILFFVSTALGYYAASINPNSARESVDTIVKTLAPFSDVSMSMLFLLILTNNALKTCIMMFLGIFFGIIPILFIFINGAIIGMVARVVSVDGGLGLFLLGTVPHGIIEIPAFLIAGAYGIKLGKGFYRKFRYQEQIRTTIKKASKKFFILIFPMLIVASLIESFLTARIIKQVILTASGIQDI